jgi:hypothetical protein
VTTFPRRPLASVDAWRRSFDGRPMPRNAVLAVRRWRRGVLAVLRRLRSKAMRLPARPVLHMPRPRRLAPLLLPRPGPAPSCPQAP